MPVRVGVHVSIAGSLPMAVERATERGCDCFQIFTRNPRGWAAREIPDDEAAAFRAAVSSSRLGPVIAHMPYLPNLASEKPDLFSKSVDTLTAELDRCDLLGIRYLVTHLGHTGDDPGTGRRRVIEAIRTAVSASRSETMVLLENTAGERNAVGSTLEEIRQVLDGIEDVCQAGICLDTCHAFAAGYEIRDGESVSRLADDLENMVGLSRLRLIHLNDAKGERGSGLDRHEHIGMGSIGEKGIRAVLSHPSLCRVPFICETPVDDRRDDAGNIIKVRELAGS